MQQQSCVGEQQNDAMCEHAPDLAGDPDEWDKVLRVNMMAPMRLMRRLTPAMVEKGEGVIINIDSSAGLSPKPGNAVYSASKWVHLLPHACCSCLLKLSDPVSGILLTRQLHRQWSFVVVKHEPARCELILDQYLMREL